MASKKKSEESILVGVKFFSLTLTLFVVSLGILLALPRGVGLIQSKVAVDSNFTHSQVAGIEKVPAIILQSKGLTPPSLSAAGALAIDYDSGQILYQKDIHKRLLPASTTKLMTALIAIDYYKMSDSLVVFSDDLVGGSIMGLHEGEKVSFRSLLYGMLLNSGNDAAFTIASNYPGGIGNFVSAMNQRAQSLGLLDSHFVNPAGFDDPSQYSSAYDLSKIGMEASLNPELAKVTSTKDTVVYSSDSSVGHTLRNVNQLLGEDGVIGIKTGYTDQAGENLVGLVDRENHKVLTVVLDSKDRFGETKSLMDWIYTDYTWKIAR